MSKKQSGFTAIEVIIVIAVIGVIGLVGWLVIGRKSTKNTSTTDTKQVAKDDNKKDSGSCFGVSKETIKSLLGTPAANLQGPSDTGVVDISKGQTCVYPFAAGATVTNSFTIDRGTYANQANLDASQKYSITEGSSVEGLGDSASYAATDAAISNSRDFVLTVRQDLKIYKFGISQPQDALTYNDASAQRILIQIALAATV